MRIADSQTMSSIDGYCIKTLGIPGVVLMENAALKVIKNIDTDKYQQYVVVCGKGNNGGDGFAVARHLHILGKKVEVFLLGSSENMKEDCRINYRIIKNIGINVKKISNVEDINELREAIEKSQVTIDCIFGTGLSKKLEGIYDMAVTIINENSRYIISVDVPSGFDSNTGLALGNSIKANKTISFQLYKTGFLSYGADKYTGEIIVEDIGIPESAINKFHENEFIMDKSMINKKLMIRDKYSYKGDYGRVLIIAGSVGYSGAAYISTQAAVRSGAGLVTLCCNKDIQQILSSKLIEAMTIDSEDNNKLKEFIKKSDAIAIGPGMGDNDITLKLVEDTIHLSDSPIVIDADGINVLRENISVLKNKKTEIILTPHMGEMSRITGYTIDYIRNNRMKVAKEFAKEYGVIILLKGYNTIITDGDMTIINPTGNSAMASGGMGDCLTGMIASFLGQGYKPMEAACISAYIHGYCGEKLSNSMFCINASHILDQIPFIVKEFQI